MANEQNQGKQQAQASQAAPQLQLDPNLIAAIATAVVQAIRSEGSAPQQWTLEDLSRSVAEAVTGGIAATTRRKVTFGEYVLRGHSIYHPKPKAETPKLRRVCWQNGTMLQEQTLFDEEVALLNQITHSGRYINRLVEISLRDVGGAEEDVHVNFSNTIERQMELKGELYEAGPSKSMFHAILKLVVKAQEQERSEAEARDGKVQQRRKFENSDFASAAAQGKKPWEMGV